MKILGADGKPMASPKSAPPARARYDSAQNTEDNRRLWADSDGLSARSANSPEVRRLLRNRARYERSNGSYLEGIIQTITNDCIGIGPRLQMISGEPDSDRAIERNFENWADEICLAEKLRTMRMARAVDGEAFALLIQNPRLSGGVTLDIRLIEADQVATPDLFWPTATAVDGIELDDVGNPVYFHLLRGHPGDTIWTVAPWLYDRIPADLVIHWYRADRPGQFRGVPEITASIADFAELRRYGRAVLAAAETAADFAAMLYTEAPADTDVDPGTAFESLEIEKRMMTTLPAGYRVEQLRSEQPTTTYSDYVTQKVTSLARCLNMPRNIALGDSSGYNYSSGRLDHQTYYKSIKVDQVHCRRIVLERIFMAWLKEAGSMLGLGRPSEIRAADFPHQWLWPGSEHVDPLKEAQAQEVRMKNFTTSFTEECQRSGVDPDVRAEMIAQDFARFERLGLELPAAWRPTPAAPPTMIDPTPIPSPDGVDVEDLIDVEE